jgi:hypothetical protein
MKDPICDAENRVDVASAKPSPQSGTNIEEMAFDEMNLIELPFALLTRDTRGIFEIPLSADGKSRLACLNSTEHGLPNSLAPRVLLGLMWMWKNGPDNGAQTFTIGVRELVERYMYPERFTAYAPNSGLMRAVERQINCIANSRIHTDRWWNHQLKARQTANVAIISDVKVQNEGGRNRPRVLQITWGQAFWESMVRRYTKAIDARLVQSIVHPIDLALYRLLDRQLSPKPAQSYADIVAFARYKLGMRGRTLDLGGRIASSYVAKKLAESLRRLHNEQFTVRMTIDRSRDPFSVTFERLTPQPEQLHEIQELDRVAELVREFHFFAHQVPREQTRLRISQGDRIAAQEWLDVYGFDKSKWMIERSARLQKERHGPTILLFRGLRLYESAAAGAYELFRTNAAKTEQRNIEDERETEAAAYRQQLVEQFDAVTSELDRQRVAEQLRTDLEQKMPGRPRIIIDAYLRSALRDYKCNKMQSGLQPQRSDTRLS